MEEYNRLKRGNYNNYDRNSDVSRSSTAASSNSTFNSQVNTEKKLSFKNGLVQSLYENFGRQCDIKKALDFFKSEFKSEKVPASNFDGNFWDEILYVINLNNCTIKQLVEFKQNVVILANEKVSPFDNWFGKKIESTEIKFAISPDMFQNLVYNSGGKIFVDYLGDEKHQECLNSFRIVLDGSNDDMGRESCGKLLDIILGTLVDNCQPVKDMIVLLQICRVLLGRDIIPVNVDGWKKIFSKIKSLSIKDFLKIRLLVDNPEVNLDDLEKFLFSKLNSKDDTQDEVKRFIAMFFPNDKIKSDDPDNRLYVFDLFIGCFPSQKLDFSFVTNFAQQRLGLKLSDLSIERLLKLLSKVKSSSINSNTFKALVELVRGKNIVLGTRNGVDELRQLLCDVLRISEPELDLSNVMDLFLLYPKMPKFCTKSTLTNESLELALKNIKEIKEIDSNNKSLRVDKKDFREKFKKFVELFEDVSNKITFDNFENLISSVPDDCLDFDCINYLLQNMDLKDNRNDLFDFFGKTLLTEKLDKGAVTWQKLHKFLSDNKFYDRILQTNTFKYIIDVFVKNKIDVDLVNINIQGNKDKFRGQFKDFVDLFVKSIESNEIAFANFKDLILAVPDDCLDFDCINHLLQKTDLKNNRNNLCKFFENTLLKKISRYKFDLSKVRAFFDNYLPDDIVKNCKFTPKAFKLIVTNVIQSNEVCSCKNENIKWLLEKCYKLGVKLGKGGFVDLINKGEKNKNSGQIKVEKISWFDMCRFISKIVSPESELSSSEKVSFNKDEISVIHRRSNFGFDINNLSVFIENIITLKKFVTDKKELFNIVLSHVPYNGLPNLDVFRKVVYYCFEDVENYDSDMQIPATYNNKVDSSLYSELLKTFEDNSLSYNDFETLNSKFFSKQQSGNFINLLADLFSQNKTNTNIGSVDHKVLRKKLKNRTLSGQELKDVFSKFEDKKLSKENFIEILMLAQNGALAINDFIDLFQKYCEDKIETENNTGTLGKIAEKLCDKNVKNLQDRLIDLNVEKGIQQLLSGIKADFSLLFKLTDKRLKDYGLSTLLNQENQENNLNNIKQRAENFVVKTVNNLDEGQYGTRMSIINFKKKYSGIWGNLKKEERVYLQMILGYKQSLLSTIFCLFLSCVLFVPATTVTYCLGVFFIIYFLLELVGERTRNRLTEMVQGKSREPSFWDKFLVWNKSVIEDAMVMCNTKGQTVTVSDTNNYYKEVKDSIFSVMMPEDRSFFDTTGSARNIFLRTTNRVASILDRNVLS